MLCFQISLWERRVAAAVDKAGTQDRMTAGEGELMVRKAKRCTSSSLKHYTQIFMIFFMNNFLCIE